MYLIDGMQRCAIPMGHSLLGEIHSQVCFSTEKKGTDLEQCMGQFSALC